MYLVYLTRYAANRVVYNYPTMTTGRLAELGSTSRRISRVMGAVSLFAEKNVFDYIADRVSLPSSRNMRAEWCWFYCADARVSLLSRLEWPSWCNAAPGVRTTLHPLTLRQSSAKSDGSPSPTSRKMKSASVNRQFVGVARLGFFAAA